MMDEKGCFWCVNREDMRCLDRHLDLRKFGDLRDLRKLKVGCRCVCFEPKNKHTTFVFR
jgi:hypothetical protein